MTLDPDSPPRETPSATSSKAPSDTSVADIANRRLGAEVRRIRNERGLTQVDVANATGLSVPMLSMLERGKTGLSVGSLVAVASALEVPVGDLFQASDPESALVRFNEQSELEPSPGVKRRVMQRSREYGLEVATLLLEPGANTGAEFVRHAGQEVLVVHRGSLTVLLEESTFVLEQGDSIRFSAERPHRFVNEGEDTAEVLVVVRLPTAANYGH
ncbi:helix-turn-helix domain-containing protein [Rhodococcus sp. NPDC057529]|uniref:helix-turn-helix domain-containing protein n=1 Tax=Rhodococcus sp. NPDC057529 TaxID=3346158 RepID=UPI0036727D30